MLHVELLGDIHMRPEDEREQVRGKERYEFTECGFCTSRPGSPILCERCVKNRSAISGLKRKLEHAQNVRDRTQTILLWFAIAIALGIVIGTFI